MKTLAFTLSLILGLQPLSALAAELRREKALPKHVEVMVAFLAGESSKEELLSTLKKASPEELVELQPLIEAGLKELGIDEKDLDEIHKNCVSKKSDSKKCVLVGAKLDGRQPRKDPRDKGKLNAKETAKAVAKHGEIAAANFGVADIDADKNALAPSAATPAASQQGALGVTSKQERPSPAAAPAGDAAVSAGNSKETAAPDTYDRPKGPEVKDIDLSVPSPAADAQDSRSQSPASAPAASEAAAANNSSTPAQPSSPAQAVFQGLEAAASFVRTLIGMPANSGTERSKGIVLPGKNEFQKAWVAARKNGGNVFLKPSELGLELPPGANVYVDIAGPEQGLTVRFKDGTAAGLASVTISPDGQLLSQTERLPDGRLVELGSVEIGGRKFQKIKTSSVEGGQNAVSEKLISSDSGETVLATIAPAHARTVDYSEFGLDDAQLKRWMSLQTNAWAGDKAATSEIFIDRAAKSVRLTRGDGNVVTLAWDGKKLYEKWQNAKGTLQHLNLYNDKLTARRRFQRRDDDLGDGYFVGQTQIFGEQGEVLSKSEVAAPGGAVETSIDSESGIFEVLGSHEFGAALSEDDRRLTKATHALGSGLNEAGELIVSGGGALLGKVTAASSRAYGDAAHLDYADITDFRSEIEAGKALTSDWTDKEGNTNTKDLSTGILSSALGKVQDEFTRNWIIGDKSKEYFDFLINKDYKGIPRRFAEQEVLRMGYPKTSAALLSDKNFAVFVVRGEGAAQGIKQLRESGEAGWYAGSALELATGLGKAAAGGTGLGLLTRTGTTALTLAGRALGATRLGTAMAPLAAGYEATMVTLGTPISEFAGKSALLKSGLLAVEHVMDTPILQLATGKQTKWDASIKEFLFGLSPTEQRGPGVKAALAGEYGALARTQARQVVGAEAAAIAGNATVSTLMVANSQLDMIQSATGGDLEKALNSLLSNYAFARSAKPGPEGGPFSRFEQRVEYMKSFGISFDPTVSKAARNMAPGAFDPVRAAGSKAFYESLWSSIESWKDQPTPTAEREALAKARAAGQEAADGTLAVVGDPARPWAADRRPDGGAYKTPLDAPRTRAKEGAPTEAGIKFKEGRASRAESDPEPSAAQRLWDFLTRSVGRAASEAEPTGAMRGAAAAGREGNQAAGGQGEPAADIKVKEGRTAHSEPKPEQSAPQSLLSRLAGLFDGNGRTPDSEPAGAKGSTAILVPSGRRGPQVEFVGKGGYVPTDKFDAKAFENLTKVEDAAEALWRLVTYYETRQLDAMGKRSAAKRSLDDLSKTAPSSSKALQLAKEIKDLNGFLGALEGNIKKLYGEEIPRVDREIRDLRQKAGVVQPYAGLVEKLRGLSPEEQSRILAKQAGEQMVPGEWVYVAGDIHLQPDPKAEANQRWNTALESIRKDKPGHVLITGDVVDAPGAGRAGLTEAQRAQMYVDFFEGIARSMGYSSLKAAKGRITFVMGNHDIPRVKTDRAGKLLEPAYKPRAPEGTGKGTKGETVLYSQAGVESMVKLLEDAGVTVATRHPHEIARIAVPGAKPRHPGGAVPTMLIGHEPALPRRENIELALHGAAGELQSDGTPAVQPGLTDRYMWFADRHREYAIDGQHFGTGERFTVVSAQTMGPGRNKPYMHAGDARLNPNGDGEIYFVDRDTGDYYIPLQAPYKVPSKDKINKNPPIPPIEEATPAANPLPVRYMERRADPQSGPAVLRPNPPADPAPALRVIERRSGRIIKTDEQKERPEAAQPDEASRSGMTAPAGAPSASQGRAPAAEPPRVPGDIRPGKMLASAGPHTNVYEAQGRGGAPTSTVFKVDAGALEVENHQRAQRLLAGTAIRTPRVLAAERWKPDTRERLGLTGISPEQAEEYVEQGRWVVLMERLPDDAVPMRDILNGRKSMPPVAAETRAAVEDAFRRLHQGTDEVLGMAHGDLDTTTNLRVRFDPETGRHEVFLIDFGQARRVMFGKSELELRQLRYYFREMEKLANSPASGKKR